MKTQSREILWCWLALVAAVVTFGAIAGAQVTPSAGITRAAAPLARVGQTVEVDTNGTMKIATIHATVAAATLGTFGSLVVGGCTGCGGGGGSGGGSGTIGTSSIDPRSLGTLKLWMKADAGVYSDTGCSAVITTGGTVACWVDQQNGLAFKNSNASQQPAWLWDRRANHPIIMFGANGTGPAGANVFTGLTATSAAGVSLASFTECAAIAPDGSSPNTADVYDVFSGSVGTLFGVQITSGFAYWQTAAPYVGTRHAGGYVPMLGSGRPSIACQTFDDATKLRQTWVDGYLASSDTEAGSIDYTGASATLAYLPPAGADNYHGEIDELLEWNAAFAPAVVGSATTYLRSRWNVDGGQGSGGGAGGGGGGGGVTDPITVNGWTPASGTATVTGAIAVTGASSTGAGTVNGNQHVTGNLTVDGAIAGVANIGTYASFVAFATLSAGSVGATNDTSQIEVVRQTLTAQHCEFTIGDSPGASIGTCTVNLRDNSGAANLCTAASFACNTGAGSVVSLSCSGSAAAGHLIDLRRTAPAFASAPNGILECSFSQAP